MRFLGLVFVVLLVPATSLLRECVMPSNDPSSGLQEAQEEPSAGFQTLIGCLCRREAISSNGMVTFWRSTYHSCSPCNCASSIIVYEVQVIGMSPGLCDGTCSDTAGCTQSIALSLASLPTASTSSFKLTAPQPPGEDDVALFGFPTGPKSDNQHFTSAEPRNSWFVDVGGTRIRLFHLEATRIGKDGTQVVSRIPVGYEATPGPAREGNVEFVRSVVAKDFTKETATPTTIEGFYEVGVRRTPDAPVEIHLVRTANSLAVTP